MPEPGTPPKLSRSAQRMVREVGAKQDRMERARGEKNSYWSSLSMLGVVGWSVTLPTLAGIVAGIWLDRHLPVRFSWTLTMLITGLVAGCASAWFQIGGKRK
jgi:ATP synthase protein I